MFVVIIEERKRNCSSLLCIESCHMLEIHWEFYPLVAQQELARTWLTVQRNLQLAPATIDAYGRNLNDYLAFCTRHSLLHETITREHLSLHVPARPYPPNPRGH